MCHHAPKENGTAQNKSEHQRPQNEHTEHRTKNNINILTWWKSQNVHIARFDSSFGIVTLGMPNYCLKNAEKKTDLLKDEWTTWKHDKSCIHTRIHTINGIDSGCRCIALLGSAVEYHSIFNRYVKHFDFLVMFLFFFSLSLGRWCMGK